MSAVTLDVEADPEEVGLDRARLQRIEDHLETYVLDGRLPGWLFVLSRGSRVAYVARRGWRDLEDHRPVEPDTLFRIFSMTKPVTSVAAMILHEEGAFELTDPVSRFIPSFADVRVYRGGPATAPLTVPATEPIRMWHLLTHTAGLTYGFHFAHPTDAIYRAGGFLFGGPKGTDLAAACDRWASFPLLFEPGTEWNYSVATDVLGRVVEVLSGHPLDRFLHDRIFEPLAMTDTGFRVDPEQAGRLATLYWHDPAGGRPTPSTLGGDPTAAPTMLSGGGGLVSSASDYHRFTQMLLGGGSLDGRRILGPRTVAFMTRNHLPGGADLEEFGRPLFAESPHRGVGFGLGFSVVVDPVRQEVPSSPGEFAWGGAASTAFWVDPVEEITAVFMTQLLPSSTYPFRTVLRQLVSQAIVG